MSKKYIEVDNNDNEDSTMKTSLKPKRRFLLTLYPEYLLPECSTIDRAISYLQTTKGIDYAVGCLEEGKEKHPHLQIYVELSGPQRISFFQRLFGKKHHYEACRGSQQDNIDYVRHSGIHSEKPGQLSNFFSFGKPHQEGGNEHTTYDIAVSMILEGKSLRDVASALGGAILPQLGNLDRLRASIQFNNHESIERRKHNGE